MLTIHNTKAWLDAMCETWLQRFCAPLENGDSVVEGLGGAGGPQQEALQAFCRQILAECMGQEKAAMLQPFLFFQTLVQLYSSTSTRGDAPLAPLTPSLPHSILFVAQEFAACLDQGAYADELNEGAKYQLRLQHSAACLCLIVGPAQASAESTKKPSMHVRYGLLGFLVPSADAWAGRTVKRRQAAGCYSLS